MVSLCSELCVCASETAGWGMTQLDDVIALTAATLCHLTSAPHPDLL
ncbi:MAG: hypothetical protein P4L40_07560 [Terracidiphilus sp.]|nr:hypothetical protein [Terracidiphilus sp.]